ncbi:MAG TPA: phage tail protein [Rhizomicrobium sp.]|nr:phage tail protein [Rhizomicrobium sp.]
MERHRILQFLPETYRSAAREGSALMAILAVMEAQHAPAEDVLARADEFIDPWRAPDDFAVMLASWLDLDRYLDWTSGRKGVGEPRYVPGLGNLRALSAEAAQLMRWRGTRYALERFLAVATGLAGFRVTENPPDEKGAARPFHIHVQAPAAASRMSDLVRRVVDEERPAYVTYDIAFSSGP